MPALPHPQSVDDHSRGCVGQLVDTSISGTAVSRFLDELGISRGLPAALVSDNDTEFTSKAMFLWSQRTSVTLHFIQR
jgi:putative transposase